jgi:N-hydroxyarylamine O-acetyltransferase
VFDLDAYLERIGVRGKPSLADIHRAHVTSIPFENLDPHRGIPVALDEQSLQRKLVEERRGGYCFEQNLLLKTALETVGLEVDLLLARVMLGRAGAIRPRSHLVLRVRADGAAWHADVGFGAGSPIEPLPFGPGGPFEQSGWRFRIVADGPELVLQMAEESGWADLYGFVPEPVPLVDVETSNWFTSTHPRSPFVTGLIVAKHELDGTRLALSDWEDLALIEHAPGHRTVTPVARASVPALLQTRFALDGFGLNEEGRIV